MSKNPRAQRIDGETTRNRILEAAGHLFAEAGFAETTNKMVAAKAGVDLASINYHFSNRAGLYQAVLIELHRRFVDLRDLETLIADDRPAPEKLRRLIYYLVANTSGKDHWPFIVLFREINAPTSHIAVLREDTILPKLRLVMPLLAEITGIPPNDPVLWRCLPCIAAPCLMLLLLDTGRPVFANGAFELPQEELTDHICSFALGGLDAIGKKYHG